MSKKVHIYKNMNLFKDYYVLSVHLCAHTEYFLLVIGLSENKVRPLLKEVITNAVLSVTPF